MSNSVRRIIHTVYIFRENIYISLGFEMSNSVRRIIHNVKHINRENITITLGFEMSNSEENHT